MSTNRRRLTITNLHSSKVVDSDSSCSDDDQSSTSRSEIGDKCVPEASCNLHGKRNEKKVFFLKFSFKYNELLKFTLFVISTSFSIFCKIIFTQKSTITPRSVRASKRLEQRKSKDDEIYTKKQRGSLNIVSPPPSIPPPIAQISNYSLAEDSKFKDWRSFNK